MNFFESIKLSFRSIRSNLLRTSLTIAIIALGIMALVGILTAMEGIKASINQNFTRMGANTFSIREESGIRSSRTNVSVPRITYHQAEAFKDRYTYPAAVSVSTIASWRSVISYDGVETHPNIRIFGVDENYLRVSGYDLEGGRNFSESEIHSGSNNMILGYDVAKLLFNDPLYAVDEFVLVGNTRYRIIGILRSRGSSVVSNDNLVWIPLNNARSNFTHPNSRFVVSISVDRPELMHPAIGEATALFRNVRRLRVHDENNFHIVQSDSLVNELINNLAFAGIMASGIGFITLLGASIALMNILLVSVTERTREIGISKAIGAKKSNIRSQFLIEAVVICQLGGIAGIILGVIAGNAISFWLDTSFIIPWVWIISGVTLCFFVGVISGVYPAIKASQLDPIEALRYE